MLRSRHLTRGAAVITIYVRNASVYVGVSIKTVIGMLH
jgi:hypothetical protein